MSTCDLEKISRRSGNPILFHSQADSKLGGLMYCPGFTKYTCHDTWHSKTHVNPPCQPWHKSMDVQPLAVELLNEHDISNHLIIQTYYHLFISWQVFNYLQRLLWCCYVTITTLINRNSQLPLHTISIRFLRTLTTRYQMHTPAHRLVYSHLLS